MRVRFTQYTLGGLRERHQYDALLLCIEERKAKVSDCVGEQEKLVSVFVAFCDQKERRLCHKVLPKDYEIHYVY